MKTWWWKVRYAVEFKRLTFCGFKLAWQDAEAWVESYGIDEEPDPKAAAAESVDAWLCSQ
jgi:hypothetical protein